MDADVILRARKYKNKHKTKNTEFSGRGVQAAGEAAVYDYIMCIVILQICIYIYIYIYIYT